MLDVGSNTVHLLVVDARRGGHPTPMSSTKAALRLAESIDDHGKLTRKGADKLIGTLDEFFESLTLIQTGKSARMPIVLFDRSFWREMINFERLAEEGMISPGDLDLFLLTDSLDEAYDFMTQRVEVVEKDR